MAALTTHPNLSLHHSYPFRYFNLPKNTICCPASRPAPIKKTQDLRLLMARHEQEHSSDTWCFGAKNIPPDSCYCCVVGRHNTPYLRLVVTRHEGQAPHGFRPRAGAVTVLARGGRAPRPSPRRPRSARPARTGTLHRRHLLVLSPRPAAGLHVQPETIWQGGEGGSHSDEILKFLG